MAEEENIKQSAESLILDENKKIVETSEALSLITILGEKDQIPNAPHIKVIQMKETGKFLILKIDKTAILSDGVDMVLWARQMEGKRYVFVIKDASNKERPLIHVYDENGESYPWLDNGFVQTTNQDTRYIANPKYDWFFEIKKVDKEEYNAISLQGFVLKEWCDEFDLEANPRSADDLHKYRVAKYHDGIVPILEWSIVCPQKFDTIDNRDLRKGKETYFVGVRDERQYPYNMSTGTLVPYFENGVPMNLWRMAWFSEGWNVITDTSHGLSEFKEYHVFYPSIDGNPEEIIWETKEKGPHANLWNNRPRYYPWWDGVPWMFVATLDDGTYIRKANNNVYESNSQNAWENGSLENKNNKVISIKNWFAYVFDGQKYFLKPLKQYKNEKQRDLFAPWFPSEIKELPWFQGKETIDPWFLVTNDAGKKYFLDEHYNLVEKSWIWSWIDTREDYKWYCGGLQAFPDLDVSTGIDQDTMEQSYSFVLLDLNDSLYIAKRLTSANVSPWAPALELIKIDECIEQGNWSIIVKIWGEIYEGSWSAESGMNQYFRLLPVIPQDKVKLDILKNFSL